MILHFYFNFSRSVLFFFLSTLKRAVFLLWTSTVTYGLNSPGHLVTFFDNNEFENCFKDSGYWDFFILIYFDYLFRVFWIFSIIKMSEFSITEKASWLISGAILSVWKSYFYFEFASIAEFFFFFAVILVVMYFLSSFSLSLLFFV